MKHFIAILFLSLISIANYAAGSERHVKVRYPEFVPKHSDISISYIFAGRSIDSDSIGVEIIPDEEISISEIIIHSGSVKRQIKFQTIESENHWNRYYRFMIDDTTVFSKKAFQIVVYIDDVNSDELYINSNIKCYKPGQRVVSYSSEVDEYAENYIKPVVIVPFTAQSVAGNSLSLPSGAGFIIEQEHLTTEKNLMVEFWSKFSSFTGDFFTLKKVDANTILSIGINDYNIIKVPPYSESGDTEDFYISDNTWYHFNLVLRYEDYLADLYINDKLIFSTPLNNFAEETKLNVEFSNKFEDEESFIELELLKVWDFNNTLGTSFLNKNYVSYFLDSSRVISDFTFDKQTDDDRLAKTELYSNQYRTVVSDAPLFSKAPELNVNSMATFYNIEWVNRDVNNAKLFALEKSTDGINYAGIFTSDAVEDGNKTYYYSDVKSPDDELVYYRIRQENHDGSVVYSSQVKIGQGNIDLFSINQNYPNPFNPVTTITIEMFEGAEVDITVYDIMGKKIEKLQNGFLSEGVHTFNFDGSELPSGIYLYEVKSIYNTVVQKMILTK